MKTIYTYLSAVPTGRCRFHTSEQDVATYIKDEPSCVYDIVSQLPVNPKEFKLCEMW